MSVSGDARPRSQPLPRSYVWVMSSRFGFGTAAAGATAAGLAALAGYDLTQRHHAILRNFPLVGHLRHLLEEVGPEFRQYMVTSNTEEKPFNRDQRRWIYASAKQENNYFAFGTSKDLETSPNYLIVKHSPFPLPTPLPGDANFDEQWQIPVVKELGAARNRSQRFHPKSVVNISGMSFGALSSNAIAALNTGAQIAGCLHNTGEGGVSRHHQHGGELIWQLGSGYFGARDDRGRFDLARLVDVVAANPVRAIEIKLSQGAKPGLGGTLRIRARLRHDQRRPRGHDVDRMHPGPALPYREVPDRCRHPKSVAGSRPRSRDQVGPPCQLHLRASQGASCAEPSLWGQPPSADLARPFRCARRPVLGATGP